MQENMRQDFVHIFDMFFFHLVFILLFIVLSYNHLHVKNLCNRKKSISFAAQNQLLIIKVNWIMKKILLALVALLTSVSSFAQYSSGGFTLDEDNLYYGIRIGMQASTLTGDAQYFNPDGSKAGLTLGGVLGLRLSDTTPIFLESGLYYTEKGGKGNDLKEGQAKDDVKATFHMLEIPILVKYGIKASDDVAVLPFFGPYFSTAIGGKTNKHSTFNKGYFNRFDAGFKLGCGVEYNMLYLEAGYQFGLSNISDNEDNSAHHGGFFANFGVNF